MGASDAMAWSAAARAIPLPQHVWHHRYSVGARYGIDALELGEPATDTEVGLRDIHAAALDQIAEAPASELGLATSDGHIEGGADGAVALTVFGRDRLLEQETVVSLQDTAHADRLRCHIGVVRIDE